MELRAFSGSMRRWDRDAARVGRDRSFSGGIWSTDRRRDYALLPAVEVEGTGSIN
jgi:hypothetical protein